MIFTSIILLKLWQAALISFRAHGRHTGPHAPSRCLLITTCCSQQLQRSEGNWQKCMMWCGGHPLRQPLPCLFPDSRAHGCLLLQLMGPEDRQVVSGGESGKAVCIRNVLAHQSWAASFSIHGDTVFIIYTVSPWGTKLGLSTNRIQSTLMQRHQ